MVEWWDNFTNIMQGVITMFKKTLFLVTSMLLVAVMLVPLVASANTTRVCNWDETYGTGYVPFANPSVNPAANAMSGYTESMPLKKVISDFTYGLESAYNGTTGRSSHCREPRLLTVFAPVKMAA